MRLPELARVALGGNLPLADIEVTGVSQDHRKVRPGHVFVARSGARWDGHQWAEQAVSRGAVAIVGARALTSLYGVPYLTVADDRAAIARLAAAFHGHPSRRLQVIGVTGTDGKTSTSFLLHHLLSTRHRTGLLSTASVRSGKEPLPLEGHFTTPEATEVQSYLARFLADGCTHAVLESSSHALAAHRLDEVEYELAVWTNLSPEHLDFHGSLEEYRNAKGELVRRAGRAILNVDDPSYPAFEAWASEVVSYGSSASADWCMGDVRDERAGLTFRLTTGQRSLTVTLPMFGEYNAYNATAALAAAACYGVDPEEGAAALREFPGVPGRMQVLREYGPAVVVDFAHTGPALEKALLAVRKRVAGRLLLVVGAAGERDPGKRRPLAEAAARGADIIFFTEEDHRSEPLEQILEQLRRAALAAGAPAAAVRLVPDRSDAIRAAIAVAREDDLVLLAGKGHEATLERGDTVVAWDEAAEARRHLG